MMDKEYSSKIKQNLDFIATNIGPVSQLLNLLLEKSVISQYEVETIKSKTMEYEAGTELAKIICQKDTKLFPVFISCLTKSGKEVIARRLMPILQNEMSQIGPITNNREIVQRQGIIWKFWSIILTLSVLLIAISIPLYNYMNTPLPISLVNISQPIWFEITALTTFYVGREKEMQLLEEYWNHSMTQKSLSVVAVTGLGGVGKTELAKNYAKVVYENFRSHCIWINAETNQSVEESFKNLAHKSFKISVTDYLRRERIFLEIVAEVYEKLFGQKVLLVFDNIENYDLPVLQLLFDLSSQLPPTVLKPFIITTSRVADAKKYFGSKCKNLELQVLSKHSAIQFFYKILDLNEPSGDNIHELIEQICLRLEFYPLTLQQASAYINERSLYYGTLQEAISSYLCQLEEHSKRMLNHKLPQYEALDSISKTTFLTWRITFNKIRNVDGGEVAMDIMNIISFLSSDHISFHIMINILINIRSVPNLWNVRHPFELLRKYSMINYSGEKLISVHRLVQEVTRIDLEERGEVLPLLNRMAKCMIYMLNIQKTSLKELVHVQAALKHLSKEKELIAENGELFWLVCEKLYISGKFKDLLDFSREADDLVTSALGQNSRWTLQMKYWKGLALNELGEYKDSLEVLNYVYEKQKLILGDEDEDFWDTANALGRIYSQFKKYKRALKIYGNTLQNAERLVGKKHHLTLALKQNIAIVLKEQKKFDEAMKLFKELLEVYERVADAGLEHPDALIAMFNMVTIKFAQESYREALKEFQDILEIEERVLEFNHPQILSTKSAVAKTYLHLDKHKEALQLFKEVHQNQAQVLGPRHPETISTEELIQELTLSSKHSNEINS